MKKQIIKVALGVIVVLTILFSSVTISIVHATKKIYTNPNIFSYNFVYALDNVEYNIKILYNSITIEPKCIDICDEDLNKKEFNYSEENYIRLKNFINNLNVDILSQKTITKKDLSDYEDRVILAIINGEYDFELNV